MTLRLAYMACEYFNADLGLAIVRAEHQAFYRRVFLHETIAEPRMFPGLLKPVGLMAADFPLLKEKVFERYPMMRSTAFERRMLFERAGATRRRNLGHRRRHLARAGVLTGPEAARRAASRSPVPATPRTVAGLPRSAVFCAKRGLNRRFRPVLGACLHRRAIFTNH